MAEQRVRIAVVGHTNTGKTSLLRTLSRDTAFGEVADTPATTRQVEGVALPLEGLGSIELFDTPGLENAGELFELLETLPGARHDGPERIRRLLGLPQAQTGFDQETRVLGQVLQADVAIYVIDTREPVLGKHQDELAILAQCARPILPVLNFVAAEAQRIGQWRAALARVNLHTVAEFDTVVFDLQAELRLWDRLRSLVDRHEALFTALMEQRREESDWRARAVAGLAASFLLDVAACRRLVPIDNPALGEVAREKLRKLVQQQEQACVYELLEQYRFGPDDYDNRQIALQDGPWRIDPFDPEALKALGLRFGSGVGTGAATGATIDVLTGGLSLGTGTVVGAVLGAGVGGWRSFGARLRQRLAGHQALIVADGTLHALLLRQQHLLISLAGRGHAARQPVVASTGTDLKTARLPAALRAARWHPEWSRFNPEGVEHISAGRNAAVDGLATALLNAQADQNDA